MNTRSFFTLITAATAVTALAAGMLLAISAPAPAAPTAAFFRKRRRGAGFLASVMVDAPGKLLGIVQPRALSAHGLIKCRRLCIN